MQPVPSARPQQDISIGKRGGQLIPDQHLLHMCISCDLAHALNINHTHIFIYRLLAPETISRVQADIEAVRMRKRERLRDLDFFILDNSIRESTVGQLRSHTIENKKQIYQEVKKCGIRNLVVATFAHMTRVDDDFCQWLKDEGEDFSQLFSFSEVTEGLRNGVYDTEKVPISLIKNKKYGLYNVVFEVDLANSDCAWDTKFTVDDMCQLILKWMRWVYDNINEKARLMLNFRDFPIAMAETPEPVEPPPSRNA